jgi:hypothetical protein
MKHVWRENCRLFEASLLAATQKMSGQLDVASREASSTAGSALSAVPVPTHRSPSCCIQGLAQPQIEPSGKGTGLSDAPSLIIDDRGVEWSAPSQTSGWLASAGDPGGAHPAVSYSRSIESQGVHSASKV